VAVMAKVFEYNGLKLLLAIEASDQRQGHAN